MEYIYIHVCPRFETYFFLRLTNLYMGVSENVAYPFLPNGSADHYPVFKWLFHWEYTIFSDKPICMHNVNPGLINPWAV